ncbi:MAG TPA: hypothetical protein VG734_16020 [Lacunisphaera sp.]|nr:hypothetical protein [Lacunisphaera sp.]
MKSLRFRSQLIAAVLAFPVLAQAHPGHDGDHGLVWDFGHLAAHPLATAACLGLIAAAGWGAWSMAKSRLTAKAERARRQ